MYIKLIVVFLLYCFGFNSIYSTNKKLFFEKVTSEFNNPNTPIYGIAKDSVGYMWFGSWNGLYRYDGTQFVVYRNDPTKPNSIPNNRIRNVITSSDGKLWVLTFDNKYLLYSYLSNDFSEFPIDSVDETIKYSLGLSPTGINKSNRVGDVRWSISMQRFMQNDIRTGESFQYFSDLLQPGTLSDDLVTWFYLDDQQILWVGTRSGEINKANWHRKPFQIHFCREWDDGRLKDRAIRAMCFDRNDLWLGTNNNGIKITGGDKEQKHSENLAIRALHKDKRGFIWVGASNVLEKIDPRTGKVEQILSKELHPDLMVFSFFTIAENKKSDIWIGTYNGLAKISASTNKVDLFDLSAIIQDHSVMKLLFDKDENLWIGTEGKGLIELIWNKEIESWSDTIFYVNNPLDINSLTGNMVYSIYEDRLGNIWAGTSKGLNRIDYKTKKVQRFTVAQGLPDDYISSVLGDEKDNIWLSHKKGISKLNGQTLELTNFGSFDGRSDWVFLDGACLKDSVTHKLYFGAREGYVSFNPSEIEKSMIAPKVVLNELKILGKSVMPKVEYGGTVILNKALALTNQLTLRFQDRSFEVNFAALHFANSSKNSYSYFLEGYDEQWFSADSRKPSATYTKVPAGEYILRVKAANPDGIWSEETVLKIKIESPWYATGWAYLFYVFFILSVLMVVYVIVKSRIRLKNKVVLERLKAEKQHEVDNMKIEFYTNISHEIRTPLSLILDPLEQLQQGLVSTKMLPEYVSLMKRNASRLMQLINQLLDFRKADSGMMRLNVDSDNWVEVVNDVVDLFKIKATKRNIALEFSSIRETISGVFDRDMVEKVIGNLLSNAFKYTNDGGTIWVKVDEDSSKEILILKVIDTGKGISPVNIDSIFDPFNSDHSRPFDGVSSGIGLALTKKIIELHNGQITVESSVNKGTCFTIEIPVAQQVSENKLLNNVETNQSLLLVPDSIVEPDVAKEEMPILLVIDDNKDIRFYIKSQLQNHYQVIEEKDGIAGFDKAIELIPDIIISDVMMPGLNGMDLCKKLKDDLRTSHIPVVLLTAKTLDDNKIEGLKQGADSYITKPFSIAHLQAQLASILDNRERYRLRYQGSVKSTNEEVIPVSVDDQLMEKVIALIDENIAQVGYNSDAIAATLNISQRQLYRKLKALTGQTVHEVITNRRLDKACELMLREGFNISETAYQVGYTEPSNFSRSFTKRFGCSPSKYISDRSI